MVSGRINRSPNKDSHEKGDFTKRASGWNPVLHISLEALEGAGRRRNDSITHPVWHPLDNTGPTQQMEGVRVLDSRKT